MDVGTLSGVFLGLVLIIGAIASGGSGDAFVHVPSVMITMGGTLSALLVTYPAGKVKAVFAVVKKSLNAGNLDLKPGYQQMMEIAVLARRDGILALEDRIAQIEDDFLRRGLQMMVDGSNPEDVRRILENEIENMIDRHSVGHSIFKSLGAYAPAFGMIGTLIGLVQMLRNLEDPSQIGAGMAVALLTTFYGALFANLFCIPIQGKLEQRTNEEVTLKRMLLSGILSIQAGDSPRVIGERLHTFMPPSDRDDTAVPRAAA